MCKKVDNLLPAEMCLKQDKMISPVFSRGGDKNEHRSAGEYNNAVQSLKMNGKGVILEQW